jgi:uncharacterized membrane protein YfcA
MLTATQVGALLVLSFFASAFTAGLGIGGGIAVITVMLQILPPAIVLPLHGVIQTGSNVGRVWAFREHVDRMIVGWFAIGSVLGVALAATVIVNLPARLLMVALALFILWSIWSPVFRAADIPVRGFSVVGAVTTFLSMFLGATGPLVAAFWNTARMGRQAVIATHGAVMTILHGLKVVTFALLGFSFAEWIPFLVAMVAAGQLGTITGKRALTNLPEEIFITAFKWALTLLALRLGYSGLFGVS